MIKIIAIPSPSKLGYSANAFILVRTELAKVDKICDQLSSCPEALLVMRLMNNFDILIDVYSANIDTLYEFLKGKMANIDGILSTEVFMHGNFHYTSAYAVFPPYRENETANIESR
jgi:DNA-binding Lrp family transcriptional regulator